jgi:4-amino-4-deoxy-L-arabinose transferase-like glycosyltransferase
MTMALVLLSTLLHLLVAGRVELSGDEAHYALYAYHLDWSYFDHPPLVGWLLAVVLRFSDSEFALRLWPMLLSVLSSGLLYRLTQRLYPLASPWVPFVAVALLHSAIVYQLLSLAMLPDTPLIPLGLAAALLLHRAVIEEYAPAWLGVGLLFGLAGLTKYTAVLLVLSALLLVAWGRWRVLRSPWPWAGIGVAALLITPVLWWNHLHDWISISYQLGHGIPQRGWSVERLGLSLAGQLLAYGPLLVVAGVAAGVKGIRAPEHRFALLMALPLLLFFGWNSGYELSLPHWTLLGWALLLPLTAHWLVSHWPSRPVRLLALSGGLYSVLVILILHSALFHPWLPFEENRYPLADLYGWEQAAQRAVELASERSAAEAEDIALFAGNWSFASHIAWYARPIPVRVTDGQYTQSDIWFDSPQKGEQGILIVPAQFRKDRKASGLSRFAHCDLLESVPVMLGDKVATSYELYHCRGYAG